MSIAAVERQRRRVLAQSRLARDARLGRHLQRVDRVDLEAHARIAERRLQVEQRRDPGERIRGGRVRLLARVHARQLDVHVARVAGVAAAVDHVQQAVAVERVAAREREVFARGDGARVGGVRVERHGGAREMESNARCRERELRRL